MLQLRKPYKKFAATAGAMVVPSCEDIEPNGHIPITLGVLIHADASLYTK